MMKHYFLMNPAAGKGKRFQALIDEIHDVCNRRKVDYTVHVTERVGDATEYVSEICKTTNVPVRFYACGGDGTINEVANGPVGHDHAELAIIPMGTGNDFVRNFKHGEKFFDIDAQLDGQTRTIDLLKYNDRYAINMINIGFDCEVAKQAVRNRRNLLVPSKVAYMVGVVQKFVSLPMLEAQISIDGTMLKGNKFQLCAFANGGFYGGGFRAAPVSTLDDGVVDACVVNLITRDQFLKLVPHYKAGTHITKIKTPGIFTYKKADVVEIKFDKPTDVCVDGEFEKISGKLVITTVKHAITLSTPKACQPIGADAESLKIINK